MLNRFSINASVRFSQNFGKPYREKDSWVLSKKSIDISFRYYFFKRGGLFIDAGGSFGHILVDMPDDFSLLFNNLRVSVRVLTITDKIPIWHGEFMIANLRTLTPLDVFTDDTALLLSLAEVVG